MSAISHDDDLPVHSIVCMECPNPADRVVVKNPTGEEGDVGPCCPGCADVEVIEGAREYPLADFYEVADGSRVSQIVPNHQTLQLYQPEGSDESWIEMEAHCSAPSRYFNAERHR